MYISVTIDTCNHGKIKELKILSVRDFDNILSNCSCLSRNIKLDWKALSNYSHF